MSKEGDYADVTSYFHDLGFHSMIYYWHLFMTPEVVLKNTDKRIELGKTKSSTVVFINLLSASFISKVNKYPVSPFHY